MHARYLLDVTKNYEMLSLLIALTLTNISVVTRFHAAAATAATAVIPPLSMTRERRYCEIVEMQRVVRFT